MPSVHDPASLLETGFEVAAHEAEPITVDRDLVLGIDGGDRVLAVLDGGDGRLQDNILDPRRAVFSDQVVGIDLDLEVQTVVSQQDRFDPSRALTVSGKGTLVLQTRFGTVLQGHAEPTIGHPVSGGLGMASLRQGNRLIQKAVGIFHDFGPACGVVRVAPLRATLLGKDVGTIKGIVQAAPASVGCVECITGDADRYHQLGTRDPRDLRIDVCGGDCEVLAFRHQIADLLQEGPVGAGVGRGPRIALVPRVDKCLEGIAFRQQLPVAGCQIVNDLTEGCPESVRIDTGSGRDLILHQVVEGFGDAQAAHIDAFDHVSVRSGQLVYPAGAGDVVRAAAGPSRSFPEETTLFRCGRRDQCPVAKKVF